jgi:glycerol-3-phosphate dehydrogenase
MQDFSISERQQNISQMKSEVFDIAIIGGGITGAGAARDAASRGLKVALIEAQDFAIGTSSRSSKLIHGGIRYLEQKEFSLVFEALSERQRLFEIAPHLVHPLRFVIPLYKSSRVSLFLMGIGMWLYDVLSLWEAPELHSRLEPEELAEKFPFLKRQDLIGAYAYSDAYMDDDRLVFETMRSAAAFGAVAANYVTAVEAKFENGKMSALVCEDAATGQRFDLCARHFISTVGPWTDIVGQNLLHHWKKVLRPAKGVHLIFHKDRLPLKDAIVMAAEERIVFGIPRNDMVIVGTTDTDFNKNPSDVRAEKDDVDYLLGVTNKYFPGAHITAADIVSVYAGVRPLVDDQSQSESKTSREHLIYEDPRNITFVAGGKYTTYRRMAEQTIDSVLKHWDVSERAKYARGQTLLPLNPKVTQGLLESAKNSAQRWAQEWKVSARIVKTLADRHGLETLEILNRYLNTVQNHATTDSELLYGLEALHAIDQTMCLTLKDFIFRRSHLFLAETDHGRDVWDFIASVMSARLGWSEAQKQDQINALQNQILFELHWRH